MVISMALWFISNRMFCKMDKNNRKKIIENEKDHLRLVHWMWSSHHVTSNLCHWVIMWKWWIRWHPKLWTTEVRRSKRWTRTARPSKGRRIHIGWWSEWTTRIRTIWWCWKSILWWSWSRCWWSWWSWWCYFIFNFDRKNKFTFILVISFLNSIFEQFWEQETQSRERAISLLLF